MLPEEIEITVPSVFDKIAHLLRVRAVQREVHVEPRRGEHSELLVLVV